MNSCMPHIIKLPVSVKSPAPGTSIDWYILYQMSKGLFHSYTHPHIYGFLLWSGAAIFVSWGTEQTTGKTLKPYTGSANSLNLILKSMFEFYHQHCYWFNTCNYMFNGEPSVSTIRNARVTIKYRAQICSKSACVNSSIRIFPMCYWYKHQQSSKIWLYMNRMYAFPIAYFHIHKWGPTPERMWPLRLSWHSRITETPMI